MAEISRSALFGKLSPLAFKASESAMAFCRLRNHPYVELQHWLFQILQAQDSDLHRIARQYDLSTSALLADLQKSIDAITPRSATAPDFAGPVEKAILSGWDYGSLMFGQARIRTGHLVIGMMKTRSLRNMLVQISKQFERIEADDLIERFGSLLKDSPEDDRPLSATSGMQAEAASQDAPGASGKLEALKRYGLDLTEKARRGEIDPVAGRDEEIRQIVDILMRRRQNNPILTGEAGVGKTAVVEGFALRLASGDVPPALRDVSLYLLDVGLLQAGAGVKGEFENRLRQVIDEVQSSPRAIILFIDEAHMLIGAGGTAGTGDAASLMKPALARGKLRTIAATTWAEYKKHIEKDPALTRRFQVVQVGEPDEDKAVLMLRGVASVLEQHHRVQLLDEAIEAAVKLSHRYIAGRQLPDKAVSLLDTACARVAVSQHALPPMLQDVQHRIEALKIEGEIIGREEDIGIDVGRRKERVDREQTAAVASLHELQARHAEEKQVVDRILQLRAQLRRPAQGAPEGAPPAEPPSEDGRTALLADLAELQATLHRLQGDHPLILPSVDEQAVGAVVHDWTGIPVGRMVRNEVQAVLQLAETINRRVIGQRHALDMIARRIQTSRARLDNPGRPIGVFLLAGSSGVGKTETALALAEALYGGEQNAITINMSEFQEAHSVSTLKGSPPGYVGYGEGGVLTEAVRRRPYSVVLLDEVEKAHRNVHKLFFQVFDKGWMEDSEGRAIDFKNTVILLTSNVGSELIMDLCSDPERKPDPEAIAQALREPLLEVFPAALLGRLVTIPYYPLSERMLGEIVKLQLGRIARRVEDHHGVPFTWEAAVVDLIVGRCNEVETGGRVIEAILTNTVLPRVSVEYLERVADGKPLKAVRLGVSAGDFTYEFD